MTICIKNVRCKLMPLTVCGDFYVPYSRKIWRALNLADWPQPASTQILTDLNLADDTRRDCAYVRTYVSFGEESIQRLGK